MQPRRKAAANVFLEQNLAQAKSDDGETDDSDEELKEQERAFAFADQAKPAPAEAPAWSARTPLAPPSPQPPGGRGERKKKAPPVPVVEGLKTSEELQLEREPIRVRETGFWPFKRVIVPPNVYVVHTRIGQKEPVTLGLGLSFHYNPHTDAYLVVPAAMQTIGIVAYSISKEKQGINILAYVQWQISDFSVAYRKLDFSDQRDPLGVVNAQLREQAEAAIKDKIATMSVEEVLTDKEPVIEELTSRLKAVAEGRTINDRVADEGLGIKIVTVQIKEALVSSQRLWENLQAPFRYEQEKVARISYLRAKDEIRQRELQNRQVAETSEAEALVEIERITQGKQTEALQIRLGEEQTRFTQEQATTRRKIQLEEETTLARQESEQRIQEQAARVRQETRLAELRREQEQALTQSRLDTEASVQQKALQVQQTLQELAEEARLDEERVRLEQQRLERDSALKRQEAEHRRALQEQEDALKAQVLEATLARKRQEERSRLELEEEANRVRMALAEQEVSLVRTQQEIRNAISEGDLARRLVEHLPAIAEQMPEIHELRVVQTGAGDGAFDALPQFLARILAVAESMGITMGASRKESDGSQGTQGS
ncbi:MAG: hypothetical protein HC884_11840 [Chloroflexaceae bacterium]|nr:hypothetical protein [Chloroflexaceae bacterium]